MLRTITGIRSTFEFPNQVNLSSPSLYCTARTDIGLIKKTINRTNLCNMFDAVILYTSYRLNLLSLKGQRFSGAFGYQKDISFFKYKNIYYLFLCQNFPLQFRVLWPLISNLNLVWSEETLNLTCWFSIQTFTIFAK